MGRAYADYYDDFDDLDIAAGRGRPPRASMAGWHALLCSLAGLGLLGLILVLGVALSAGDLGFDASRALVFAVLGLDALVFGMGLAAVVLGMKALSPTNPLYRGYGTTGLVVGIFELLLALGVGFVFFCIGMFVEVLRGAGG